MITQQPEPLSPASFVERRKHKRYAMVVKYSLTIDDVDYKGLTGNISLGGAYLSTIHPLITEESLFQEGEIELDSPDSPIRLRCYLTYVGTEQNEYPTGVGVAFIEPDENLLVALAAILGEDL